MGEMADYILDQMFDEDDGWYEPDLEDEYAYHNIRCKYCHKAGFYWIETNSGWRLHTKTGKIHECAKHRTAQK